MSYEEVVSAIIALVTLIITVGKPLWTISAKISTIEVVVKQIQLNENDLREQVKDHEKRIRNLEH